MLVTYRKQPVKLQKPTFFYVGRNKFFKMYETHFYDGDTSDNLFIKKKKISRSQESTLDTPNYNHNLFRGNNSSHNMTNLPTDNFHPTNRKSNYTNKPYRNLRGYCHTNKHFIRITRTIRTIDLHNPSIENIHIKGSSGTREHI